VKEIPSVYLETTIPSYLAARPSNDRLIAAHQLVTHDWWKTAKSRFRLFVSEEVLYEIQHGDPVYAARRLTLVDGIEILPNSADVERLVKTYFKRLGLSGAAMTDLPTLHTQWRTNWIILSRGIVRTLPMDRLSSV
jgi:hypothetical protein